VWAEKDPEAAARLTTARPRIAAQAEKLDMPVENLLTPDFLRRIAWRPPAEITLESISAALAELGARPWQIERVAAVITVAFLDPDPLPVKAAAPKVVPGAGPVEAAG
jgi:ribonuclease D